jgi:FtsP/CotA-like multicopper oxidase with cupredoxin domain
MSKTQRLTFLGIAVVIAIVAVVVLVGGEETGTSTAETTATPAATADETATATATPTPTPTATPPPLLQGGKVTKLEFTEGETVRFRVTSDVPEEVHVHGYDIAKDLEPGKVVTMSFKGDITGIFEIEYEHAGEQIGQLRVDPK